MPLIKPMPLGEAFARVMAGLLLVDRSLSPQDAADSLLGLLRSGKLRSERFDLRRNYRHVLTRSDWEKWRLYPSNGSVRVRRLDGSTDQDDEWQYFVDGVQFDRLCPAVRAPARRESVETEYEMIRTILARKFPEKAPHYTGMKTGYLEKEVEKGWNDECRARKLKHLIGNPPDRYKVGRAIGRRKPH